MATEEGSSSSLIVGHKYDVFLSFRGADECQNFINHLHSSLQNANITTFVDEEDEEEIETGRDLKPEVESAIKASRASLIVLSKNYADSSCCLEELVLIIEQRKSNHIVIPIYYHVEPIQVREQSASFAVAMVKHISRMHAETDPDKRRRLPYKLRLWINALRLVTELKGLDVKER